MGPREKCHFFLLSAILLMACWSLMGCSVIKYRSSGIIPVSFSRQVKHTKIVKVSGKKQFFLFGFVPQSNNVFIDQLMKEKGHNEVSKINIHEWVSITDFLMMVVSLGLYTPRSFTITALSKEPIHN